MKLFQPGDYFILHSKNYQHVFIIHYAISTYNSHYVNITL